MYRFFVEPSQIKDNQICISGSDVNHIKNVLRMKLKEEILISSGEDKEYTCYIEEIGEEEILAHIMCRKPDMSFLPKFICFRGSPKVIKWS